MESRQLLDGAGSATLDIPDDLTGIPGGQIVAPVQIDDAGGLHAAEIHLKYQTPWLDATEASVRAGSVWPADAVFVQAQVDDAQGTIVAWVYGVDALPTGDGSLLEVDFAVRSDAPVGEHAYLDLQKAILDETAVAGIAPWDETTAYPPPPAGPYAGDGLATIAAPPEATASISGFVYADANSNNLSDANEGVPGVKVTLSGAGVTQETWTDDDGWYQFGDLTAGTYQIVERQPAALSDGGPDTIANVVIVAGQDLGDQDFREAGLLPKYVTTRLLATSTQPMGSAAWRAEIRRIVANAEKQSGSQSEPAPAAVVPQVVQTGTTLTVQGGDGDNVIKFTPGQTQHTVSIDGEIHRVDAAKVQTVVIAGGLGHDTVRVTASTAKDTATLSPKSAVVKSPAYTVHVSAAEHIHVAAVKSSAGTQEPSKAVLVDSPADDTLEVNAATARMAAYYYTNEVADFEQILARSTAGDDVLKRNGSVDFVLQTEGTWSEG